MATTFIVVGSFWTQQLAFVFSCHFTDFLRYVLQRRFCWLFFQVGTFIIASNSILNKFISISYFIQIYNVSGEVYKIISFFKFRPDFAKVRVKSSETCLYFSAVEDLLAINKQKTFMCNYAIRHLKIPLLNKRLLLELKL